MFAERLDKNFNDLPPAERTLAAYIQANLDDIAFENGESLARKSGVSPNTVSRFLRRLGYAGLKSLKEELRDQVRVQSLLNPTLIERVDREGANLGEPVSREIEALVDLSKQLDSPRWTTILDVVSSAEKVFVCGFQTVSGLAEDFANRLALVRPGVEFLNLYGGVIGPWLDSNKERSCLILIDIAPYAEAGITFAQECVRNDAELVVFADEYGIAQHVTTPHIITMQTKTGLILESTGGLTTALNFLVHGVASLRKDELKDRVRAYQERVKALKLYRT
ncbi:RpiR family transcriptional regulator [Litchfieldella qijiaojingensis]|uniref:RpiR family transcriptional regulator n=1 Tax=Litchfieldella qijiaojingensis TaxID=980347 RepID=A0ABQ2YP65_9GAMM|nr:MurR/RpiR family transcriptional regulator [Halomonas qijiaojingensis]GGX89218.1 RpiR family transcriptional regulator [Halomonas qijiaojingensis]